MTSSVERTDLDFKNSVALLLWLVLWLCRISGTCSISCHHCDIIITATRNEPPRDKTNKMACAPSEDSVFSIRPVWSVFTVHMKKAWVLSYPFSAQRRLWSDWAYCHFVDFVMLWLICKTSMYLGIKVNAMFEIKLRKLKGMQEICMPPDAAQWPWADFSLHLTPMKDSYNALKIFEPPHDKTIKMSCVPSEDSDQSGPGLQKTDFLPV